MANVVYFAEDHSYSANYANFGVGRDAREGRESAEPSTPLPSQVSQGEGVWKWSRLRYRYVATKMMSLTTTVIGP